MNDIIFPKLKKALPAMKKNVVLKEYTTFKIGGPATYFLLAATEKEIMDAIEICKELHIPIFVMGGGSNLLVSDQGFKGLVVKNDIQNPITLLENDVVEAPGGIVLGTLVEFSINNSLEGLEWAGGLPGSFGGAIRGNAGCFGAEMKDSILEVKALDNNLSIKILSNEQCEFSYRSSIFKRENWVVLSASVKLKKGDKEKLQEISDSHKTYRTQKHPLEYPSAGSVFKNVDVNDLSPQFQELFFDKIKQDPFPIVPAAWFIIGAGLTGKQIGQAQISKKHSNYIVNLGGAKAQDVLELITLVKEEVKQKYGVKLEQEVQYLE